MQKASLDQLKERLKPLLRRYIEDQEIILTRDNHFVCPNPGHKDRDPSAHLVPDSNDTYWTCFGCGATGDIFTLAHWNEGLPLSGTEFIMENMQVLANRYGVPFEPVQLTDQELYLMQLRQLYRHAADTLVEFQDNRGLLEERGLPPRLCYDMRVGVVKSWQEFRSRLMAKANYSVKFIQDSGIYETLFNPFCITFTLFDVNGQPVGFAARDSRYGKVQNTKKFRVTEAKVPIFKKSEILYGFHFIKSKPVTVTVVEGYTDVLSAMANNIEGFTAVLTSGLTDEQVEILQKHGKTDIVLALDHDAETGTGQKKTEDCLDDVLSGKKSLRVRVADLASASTNGQSVDPDEFLRSQSDPGSAWQALPKIDAFEWRLQRLRGEPPEVVSERMVSLILNEPQHARQEVMLEKLSQFTGIRLSALQSDLDDRLYETDRKRKDQAREILDQAQKRLRYADPLETDQLLNDAGNKIKALKRETKAIVTMASTLEMVDSIQERFLNKGEGLAGLKTGLPKYDERMGGLAKEDCYMVIGGIPHVGKTSFCCHLGWNVASLNENVCILYYSIDDAIGQIYPKFVSMHTGIPITHVAQPLRYLDEAGLAKLQEGWTQLKFLVQTGRLEVRDATFGTSVGYLSGWVDQKRKQFKDRHVVAFLDNLHKLREHAPSIRERFRGATEDLKMLSQSGRCSVVATAELVKGADRKQPTLQDFMETGQIEHDATIAAVFHNELQVDPGTDIYWLDNAEPNPMDRRKPVVELRVKKNKNIDGAFKGALRYEFDPRRSFFKETLDDIPVQDGPKLDTGGGHPHGQAAPSQGSLFGDVKP